MAVFATVATLAVLMAAIRFYEEVRLVVASPADYLVVGDSFYFPGFVAYGILIAALTSAAVILFFRRERISQEFHESWNPGKSLRLEGVINSESKIT